MGKRFIKVDRPMAPRASVNTKNIDVVRPPGCKTTFIKNLPYDCTEEEIEEVFKVYGKNQHCSVSEVGAHKPVERIRLHRIQKRRLRRSCSPKIRFDTIAWAINIM